MNTGLIDCLGGLSDALDYLHARIEEKRAEIAAAEDAAINNTDPH